MTLDLATLANVFAFGLVQQCCSCIHEYETCFVKQFCVLM